MTLKYPLHRLFFFLFKFYLGGAYLKLFISDLRFTKTKQKIEKIINQVKLNFAPP